MTNQLHEFIVTAPNGASTTMLALDGEDAVQLFRSHPRYSDCGAGVYYARPVTDGEGATVRVPLSGLRRIPGSLRHV